jgi:hypothetical protein
MCLGRDTPATHAQYVTNCNVTKSDYVIGITRYSIRARAIP